MQVPTHSRRALAKIPNIRHIANINEVFVAYCSIPSRDALNAAVGGLVLSSPEHGLLGNKIIPCFYLRHYAKQENSIIQSSYYRRAVDVISLVASSHS